MLISAKRIFNLKSIGKDDIFKTENGEKRIITF